MLQSTIKAILDQMPAFCDRAGVAANHRDAIITEIGDTTIRVCVGEIHWEGEYEFNFSGGMLVSAFRVTWFDGNSILKYALDLKTLK